MKYEKLIAICVKCSLFYKKQHTDPVVTFPSSLVSITGSLQITKTTGQPELQNREIVTMMTEDFSDLINFSISHLVTSP